MQPPRSLTLVAGAILALAALILPTVPVIPAHAAQTLVVNTTADAGACPGSSCSLRGAINRANADGSGDTITFNIPNSDSGCFGTPKVCHIDVTTTQFPPLTAN